jgi:hypothetical protein
MSGSIKKNKSKKKTYKNIDNNLVIILTSTVNVNMNKSWIHQKDSNLRLLIYLKSIKNWLYNTNFKIVVIENSGYNYEELQNEKKIFSDRFEVINYKEDELKDAEYLNNNVSKGASEMFAINYAFNMSHIINSYNPIFIIKITCRYYIPLLEEFLKYHDLNNYDCLTQNRRTRCEMVGSHINNFNNIFNINLRNKNDKYDGHAENVWKYRTSQYPINRILVCPEFNIEKTPRGGVDQYFLTI